MLKHLIPAPKKLEVLDGTLTLKSAIYTNYEDFAPLADTLCECVNTLFNITLKRENGGIILEYSKELPTNVYILDSTGENLVLKASSYEAMAHALATALQAVSKDGE